MKTNINRLAALAAEKAQARIVAAKAETDAAVESAAKLVLESVPDPDSPEYPLVAAAATVIRERLGRAGVHGAARLPYGSLSAGLDVARIAGRPLELLEGVDRYSHYWPSSPTSCGTECGSNMTFDPLLAFKQRIVAAEAALAKAELDLAAAQAALS